MPINVTMISTLPPIVGLSPYTKGLVSELSKHIKINFLGFHHIYPKAIYPGKMRDETAERLQENENLNIRNVLNWYNPFQWIYEAFRIKTDIIHAQWWSFFLAPIFFVILGINKLRGKKIILTIHNVLPHEKSFLKILMNRSIYFLGDVYIVHTQKNKESFEKIIKKKPIFVIPHGLIETPLKGISKEHAREELGINQEDKILLCFGHIRDYKGIDTALEALALIDDPTVKLMIAGKCWEEWNKYEALIQKLNLSERVILKLGFIPEDETEILFKASDLLLLPYKHFDAQSGVGAAVLIYNIPMIVAKTGGLPAYIEDIECLIDPDDAEDLSKKIKKILSDKTLLSNIRQNLLIKKNSLSWNAIAQQTRELYAQY